MFWKKPLVKNSSAALLFVGAAAALLVWTPNNTQNLQNKMAAKTAAESVVAAPRSAVLHIATPKAVHAIYMTSWVASTKNWRNELVAFVKKSDLNSIVIDVKDYSGYVSFETGDPVIQEVGSEQNRIRDVKEFIDELHKAGIYTIARITVFQDPVFAKKYPELAVQYKSGSVWKDRKGLSYVDPAADKYWEYVVHIAKASEQVGFDELNFDYIRYPSDGNMKDIVFRISQSKLAELRTKKAESIAAGSVQSVLAASVYEAIPQSEPTTTPQTKKSTAVKKTPTSKEIILTQFFSYLHNALKDVGVPISADVFGMTMNNTDDLNIGQVLEDIAPHFDYIAPMVYPSHYPATFHGFQNPAAHPYEIVRLAMSTGAERLTKASSSPEKLRPWLQDFNLGAVYDAAKVKAQMQAVYDSGLKSWMVWDPANKYTREAYQAN